MYNYHVMNFDWDDDKDAINRKKHRVSFTEAQEAFFDPKRLIFEDIDHSTPSEKRYYCLGKVGEKVCTVRYTCRDKIIRIFGAGYWRKEQKIYYEINNN